MIQLWAKCRLALSRHRSFGERPLRADCVEKVRFRRRLKILGAAGASLSLRGEGPDQLPQKRSLAVVSILQRLAAAEIANALHLRDFRSSAIFEFFNTICQKRTCLHQGNNPYSITSSAWASSVAGTVRPSALAVLRLMTSSNLVGCWTGKSDGLAPLRILCTYVAVCRDKSGRFAP